MVAEGKVVQQDLSFSITAGLTVQAHYKANIKRDKEEKERLRVLAQYAKKNKKAEAVATKLLANQVKQNEKLAADALKALGPKRKTYFPKGFIKECHECLVNYPIDPRNAIYWVSCDYCAVVDSAVLISFVWML